MRAWIEPDDDEVPTLSVLTMDNGSIVGGYFRAAHPKQWHIEIDHKDIPR